MALDRLARSALSDPSGAVRADDGSDGWLAKHGSRVHGSSLRYRYYGATLGAIGLAAAAVAGAYIVYATSDIFNTIIVRILSQRVERDARDEVYLNLLGKSQTFHGRQRVGEIMARVTNDVQQACQVISPGFNFVIESGLSLIVPLIVIATMNTSLLLVPVIFLVTLVVHAAGDTTAACVRYRRHYASVSAP